MPVQVATASHEASRIGSSISSRGDQFAEDGLEVLKGAGVNIDQIKEMLQSSFDNNKLPSSIYASENGFVRSVISSYNEHHHLTLRPEDIWFAILTQISSYINAHAEELRDKFVDHQGKKELVILYDRGNRQTWDFGAFAYQMTKFLEENIVDSEYRDWLMPKFTTTTKHDQVVASIIMMATMGSYFKYIAVTRCGIPSVTLLGQKTDYELILRRLDELETLGAEPSQFAEVLRPVLKRMVRTFDEPADASVIDFWQRVVDVRKQSGGTTYSGWITAFCFWDREGKSLHRFSQHDRIENYSDLGPNFNDRGELLHLMLDGVRYHKVDDEKVPAGWSKVPVVIKDGLGSAVQAEMVAGSVGISCSASGVKNKRGAVYLNTMQPQTGWWIYEKYGGEGSDNGRKHQSGLISINKEKAVLRKEKAAKRRGYTRDDDDENAFDEGDDEEKPERAVKRMKR